MVKKLGFVVLGLLMLTAVVLLGFQATRNTSYVVWFGLASVVLAPFALNVIVHASKMDDQLLFRQLLKVPQIDTLIQQVRTQEEEIRLLDMERERLSEVIQVEARRQTLIAQLGSLEKRMAEALTEHKAVTDELELIGVTIEASPVLKEARRLQERIKARKKGRVIVVKFRGRELAFPEKEFSSALPDTLMLLWLRSIEARQRRATKTAGERRS